MELRLHNQKTTMSGDVRAFLGEADRRIERFQFDRHISGFVPSDYSRVYATLRALVESDLMPGELFCEWGSGFGVVTCLAAMLGFDARGVEIEPELVNAARQIAADFEVSAEFVEGSFIPMESRALSNPDDQFAWLTTRQDRSDVLGFGPADFDVIYAYPWPDEERLIGHLFDRHAAEGALLMTYHEDGELRIRRRGQRKRRRPSSRR